MDDLKKAFLAAAVLVAVSTSAVAHSINQEVLRSHRYASPPAIEYNAGFSEEAHTYLVKRFEELGLLNINSPLFDFNDARIKRIYEGMSANYGKPRTGLKEAQIRRNIENSVESHLREYGNRTLIVVYGETTDILGAVKGVQDRFDVDYISITPKKPGIEDIVNSADFAARFGNALPERLRTEKAIEMLGEQMDLQLGVTRAMDYSGLEAFLHDVSYSRNAKNLMIGIEETGLRSLYGDEDKKRMHEILADFIKSYRPNSILYLIDGFPMDSAAWDFLNDARDNKITTVASSFGIKPTITLPSGQKLFY